MNHPSNLHHAESLTKHAGGAQTRGSTRLLVRSIVPTPANTNYRNHAGSRGPGLPMSWT
ncbi:hypothetical protein BS17DRAFT_774360 [Gyrodon lividus]|nr:hypothetical protein BS17DRAFT_774360 [Gyrodon lividus]